MQTVEILKRVGIAPIVFLSYLFVGIIIYFSSFNYGYIMDDFQQIVNHPGVHNLSYWTSHFYNSTMFMENGNAVGGIYYKPLMMVLYSMIWNFGSGDSFFFHVFQFILHCFNAFLIFSFFTKFKLNSIWLSYFCGLIFLVHPINSEAVLHIADLQDPLYTFFGLLLLLNLTRDDLGHKSSILLYLILLCGFLSKESFILFVLVGFAYLKIYRKEKIKIYVIPAVISIISYLILRIGLANLSDVQHDTTRIAQADLLVRLTTLPKVVTHYINLFLYPNNISLTQDWVVSQTTFSDFWFPVLQIIFWLILFIAVLIRFKNKSLYFFCIWIALGFGLHSHLIPLDGTVADRWFYFTSIGILGFISVLCNYYNFRLRFVLPLVFIILSAFSYRTYVRSLDWKTPIDLFMNDIKVDPDSIYLNNNIGQELMLKNNYLEAKKYFLKVIKMSRPNSKQWMTGNLNLAAAYLFTQDFEKAKELAFLSFPLNDVKAYRIYAVSLLRLNSHSDLKFFLKHQALRNFPNDKVLTDILSTLE